MKKTGLLAAAVFVFLHTLLIAQAVQEEKPEWCRALPRPEYKTLERIPVDDPWFEVYQVVPQVFAIYEPHHGISFLMMAHSQEAK